MLNNWTPGDWFGFIAVMLPVVGAAVKGIKHLGAIERLLSDLSRWVHTVGNEVVDLRGRVTNAEKRLDGHDEDIVDLRSLE